MDRLQVNLTCVLLNIMFTLITAQFLPITRCQPCKAGYFVEKNCSVQDRDNKWKEGVRCKECTNCSAAGQVTLVKCSTFLDSQCGSQSIDVKSTASAPDASTALIVIVLLLFLILLLTLCHIENITKCLKEWIICDFGGPSEIQCEFL